MHAILIPADDTRPAQLVDVHPSRIAEAIGAKWFELVRHAWLHQRSMIMAVDEEGLLNGAAPNRRATAAFYPYNLGICGDALILAQVDTDEGPDLGGLSDFQVGQVVGREDLEVEGPR